MATAGPPRGPTRLASSMLLLAALLPGCRPAAHPPEIRVGLLGILEGAYAQESGLPSRRGAELAVRERNAAGGLKVAGVLHHVRLVSRGYAGRGDAAAAQAQALINKDSVLVLVGPQLSAHAIPVSVLAEQARVPMISPMSSNAETTEGKRYVFRLAFLDDFQGEVLGHFAREDLNASRAAVLYDESSAYSRGLAERFRRSFEGDGGKVVAVELFTSDMAPDYATQLRRIAGVHPDVLLLPNSMAADSIQLRQIQELGLKATILGTDLWDPVAVTKYPAAQGAFITHQWDANVPADEVRAFVERFRAAYGVTPRTTAAMTYDATRLVLDAIERAGSLRPEAIRVAIATTSGFRGVTGTVTFTGEGDPRRSAYISLIRDGALVPYKTVRP